MLDEAMGKREKWLHLWIYEMTTDFFFKGTRDDIVERLKAKEIYSPVTQGQENVRL